MHLIVMDLIGKLKLLPSDWFLYVDELHMVYAAIYKRSWWRDADLLS